MAFFADRAESSGEVGLGGGGDVVEGGGAGDSDAVGWAEVDFGWDVADGAGDRGDGDVVQDRYGGVAG